MLCDRPWCCENDAPGPSDDCMLVSMAKDCACACICEVGRSISSSADICWAAIADMSRVDCACSFWAHWSTKLAWCAAKAWSTFGCVAMLCIEAVEPRDCARFRASGC